MVADLQPRELRNDLTRVLRRVELGERLRVSLRGRPVAELVPVTTRPRTMTWPASREAVAQSSADANLRSDLANALSGSTDEVPIG